MIQFIIYNNDGKIIRVGVCSEPLYDLQAQEGEKIIVGNADPTKHKIVDGKRVDKTPQEIMADTSEEMVIPVEEKQASITNQMWQDLMDRLDALES